MPNLASTCFVWLNRTSLILKTTPLKVWPTTSCRCFPDSASHPGGLEKTPPKCKVIPVKATTNNTTKTRIIGRIFMIDNVMFDMLVLHQYVAQITLNTCKDSPKKPLVRFMTFLSHIQFLNESHATCSPSRALYLFIDNPNTILHLTPIEKQSHTRVLSNSLDILLCLHYALQSSPVMLIEHGILLKHSC